LLTDNRQRFIDLLITIYQIICHYLPVFNSFSFSSKRWFLGENDTKIPAGEGDILISEIREPHGVLADTKMRIIVTIAPPI
jgi:hypothetical protein